MLSCAVGEITGVRLDWNESPFGPSPQAVARVMANAVNLHRYPRGLLNQVTTAVANYQGVGADCVLLTNGVDEAVDLTLSRVESAWFVVPGFDGYADRARACGKATCHIPLDAQWEPTVSPQELAQAGAVFLAQPHNPTGNMFRREWMRQVIASAELAFLDTTYIDFAGAPPIAIPVAKHPNLLVFQSFSKAFGLAGIRLGALIGEPALIDTLRGRQRFHSVDSVALHAVAGALEDLDHKAVLCQHIEQERPRYVAALKQAAVFDEVRDTQANFVVAHCRDDLPAEQVAADLAARGVWVRDCSSLGLQGWLRITIGTSEDLRRLCEAFNSVERSAHPMISPPYQATKERQSMATKDFEHRLIEALQPIRYLALAHALYVIMDSGVYDTIDQEPGLTAAAIAQRHGLNRERFTGLCYYLANEGYVIENNGWRLTDKARTLAPFRPWYTLMVGGYSQTFDQLGNTIKAGAPWGNRDGAKVGAGSCGMSMYDALPLSDSLLGDLPAEGLTVVDLGCGDGAFLTELVRLRPGLRGVGIEPDPRGVHLAEERVQREGLTDRITVHQGRAADAVSIDLPGGPLCFLTAFVLQEMLEQDGDAAVEDLLRKTIETYPESYWLVIEVDHQFTDRRSMAHALSQAYYNPYFLLHAITEQRLEKREFWEAMFHRAGLEVAAFDHPDEHVDSTRLELGYLLRRAPRTS